MDNTPTREVRSSGVRWSIDGKRWYGYEYDVVTTPDWRDTIIGPVNFGHVWHSPRRLVVVDRDSTAP